MSFRKPRHVPFGELIPPLTLTGFCGVGEMCFLFLEPRSVVGHTCATIMLIERDLHFNSSPG